MKRILLSNLIVLFSLTFFNGSLAQTINIEPLSIVIQPQSPHAQSSAVQTVVVQEGVTTLVLVLPHGQQVPISQTIPSPASVKEVRVKRTLWTCEYLYAESGNGLHYLIHWGLGAHLQNNATLYGSFFKTGTTTAKSNPSTIITQDIDILLITHKKDVVLEEFIDRCMK